MTMLYYIAWFQAAVATAGSLFFSEVMDLPPCVLCWYQRIAQVGNKGPTRHGRRCSLRRQVNADDLRERSGFARAEPGGT